MSLTRRMKNTRWDSPRQGHCWENCRNAKRHIINSMPWTDIAYRTPTIIMWTPLTADWPPRLPTIKVTSVPRTAHPPAKFHRVHKQSELKNFWHFLSWRRRCHRSQSKRNHLNLLIFFSSYFVRFEYFGPFTVTAVVIAIVVLSLSLRHRCTWHFATVLALNGLKHLLSAPRKRAAAKKYKKIKIKSLSFWTLDKGTSLAFPPNRSHPLNLLPKIISLVHFWLSRIRPLAGLPTDKFNAIQWLTSIWNIRFDCKCCVWLLFHPLRKWPFVFCFCCLVIFDSRVFAGFRFNFCGRAFHCARRNNADAVRACRLFGKWNSVPRQWVTSCIHQLRIRMRFSRVFQMKFFNAWHRVDPTPTFPAKR